MSPVPETTVVEITTYRLRVETEAGRRFFLLAPGENRIGSAADNAIIIGVPGVSRHHARLHLDPDRILLEDLGSRNGTRIGRHRVHRGAVESGQKIRFGPVPAWIEPIDADDVRLAVALTPAIAAVPRPCDESTAAQAELGSTDAVSTQRGEHGPPGLVFPDDWAPSRSASMRRLYSELSALAPSDLPVLIEGETGVGKEHIAGILHASSHRRHGPLVAINCAALPAELLEAEMFGIGDRVATGVRGRQGRFRDAAGGTVFLDEIGDMAPELQAKLLRVLQEKEVLPLGEAPVAIDVRVVAATNIDLIDRVERGEFRRDLYYRVAGSVVRVPPLRERRGDLPALIEHFLRRGTPSRNGAPPKSIRGLTVRALELLSSYSWPGNVRELEHEVERLAAVCPHGEAIDSSMLAERVRASRAVDTPGEPASEGAAPIVEIPDPSSEEAEDPSVVPLETLERQAVAHALRRTRGNQVRAARLLGITRSSLRRRMQRFGLQTS